MKRQRTFIKNVLAGVLIGIGCVLPGVSGGVMAVSFGLYRPMLDAVLGFFRDVKHNFLFLIPLAIGGCIGYLTGAKALSAMMSRYETPMLFLLIGFVVGGIPDLINEAHNGRAFRPRCLWALGIGICISLPLAFLPSSVSVMGALAPVQALLAGAVQGVGTIVPGLSASFVLIYLGWYEAYLNAIATLDMALLVWIAGGFVAASLIMMKLIQWLFNQMQDYAYYLVLGILVVSIYLVFPGFETGDGLYINLLMLVIGLYAALRMGRLSVGEVNQVE